MERSIEILKILRSGLESMVENEAGLRIHYTRMFNFAQRRVSLRMEVVGDETGSVPMGCIDVVEISTGNGKSTCNCTLTEMQTGIEQRIILRLKDAAEREKECEKVFSFFRNVLSISDNKPLDGGFSSTRGAHQNPPSERTTDQT